MKKILQFMRDESYVAQEIKFLIIFGIICLISFIIVPLVVFNVLVK